MRNFLWTSLYVKYDNIKLAHYCVYDTALCILNDHIKLISFLIGTRLNYFGRGKLFVLVLAFCIQYFPFATSVLICFISGFIFAFVKLLSHIRNGKLHNHFVIFSFVQFLTAFFLQCPLLLSWNVIARFQLSEIFIIKNRKVNALMCIFT